MTIAFGERVRAESNIDPVGLLRSLISNNFIAPDALRQIFRSLAPHFCTTNHFEPFYALAAQYGVARQSFNEKAKGFENSTVLPFLLLQNDLESIIKALEHFSRHRDEWVVTPAVAWTIRHLVADWIRLGLEPQGPRAESVIWSYLKFIDLHAADYWGRAHCEELIGATTTLLGRRYLFTEKLQAQIVAVALRCYGLSRVFWQRISELALDTLPVEIRLGAKAFRAIREQAEAGRRDFEEELRFFEAWKCHDVPRFRLELFGPFSIPVDGSEAGETLLTRIQAAGLDVGEVVVRGLAFPGTPFDDPDLSEVAARALRSLRHTLPRSSQYELQKSAAAESLAMIARLRENPSLSPTEAGLFGLLEMLVALEFGSNAHMGIGLGASVLCSLAQVGAEAVSMPLASYLSALIAKARQVEKGKSLTESRYLASVYPRLQATAERTRDPRLLALTAAFPERFAQLSVLPGTYDPAVSALWEASSPIFDTLVVVYSCNASLEGPVAELREGWLSELAALGIPYLVAVGDGDGTLDGDILRLDAPDTYEALIFKSRRLVQWVYRNTPFAHVLKVDDDCYVDPVEMFTSLSWRKFNYFGRRVNRTVGKTPRNWHMHRSITERGRLELNRSPEPASFADGGSSYFLSRMAMKAACTTFDSKDGAHLLLSSVSEDKFIGDTLAMSGIKCSNEDNYITVYRKTHSGGTPILRWANDFVPSKAAPVKLVHYDAHPERQSADKLRETNTLWSKRIWPSTGPIQVNGGQGYAIELLSSESSLAHVVSQDVVVLCAQRNELHLLPHFLDHYRGLGVNGFMFTDNLSDDGSLNFLLEQPDVAVFSAEADFSMTQGGTDWKLAMMAQFRVGKWSLVADADEFLIYPGYETTDLPTFLKGVEASGADAVRSFMLDMYPKHDLAEADLTIHDPFSAAGWCDRNPFSVTSLSLGAFSNYPSYTSGLRHRLITDASPSDFTAQKIPLLRYMPWMRVARSLHSVGGIRLAQQDVLFAHFKYTSEFKKKVQIEVNRGQYFNNAEEYRKYLALLAEGRDVIYDSSVSVPWRESPFVRNILG
ncbi:glycosyltransferase family 2 protein [Cereibacter sphaeroides]|uniref:glycosyltransferase family 2 protein n=1 Tax=Cereibacter sphaeroides TaxID=1063 RepID=UPI001F1DDF40|nr:glycosyltransferase family 2 protein [Cereibacter sphaeroides]MCE6967050.1 glycosyltransferase family 2 protein [Cereibacter sphaeroides]